MPENTAHMRISEYTFRMNQEKSVSMELPTRFGIYNFRAWPGERGRETIALSTPHLDPSKEIMLRIHSECITGDTFGSFTCDCGAQKETALREIHKHGNGIFIYHRQEGRNTGIVNKVLAYNLMQKGVDTHEAISILSGHPDPRDYSDVLVTLNEILNGHKSPIRLLTNNPYKKLYLERNGYRVSVQPLQVGETDHNASYRETKIAKFMHGQTDYEPYVGAVLYKDDLGAADKIRKILWRFGSAERGRNIFLGVAIENIADMDEEFIANIRDLYKKVSDLPEVKIILHLEYPRTRTEQRMLSSLLRSVNVTLSLQFRISDDAYKKIDFDLLDSFSVEHIVLQIKSKDIEVIEKEVLNYFNGEKKFIMIDNSWGDGSFETTDARRESIQRLINRGVTHIVLSGGYGPDTVSQIYELEDYFKIPLSVDAESRLRTKDTFDVFKFAKYLSFFYKYII
jgi:GTP cyclohydrolase II